jgi:hypothetical protein
MKTMTWLPRGLVGAILTVTLGFLWGCSTAPTPSPSQWAGEARQTPSPSPPRQVEKRRVEKPAFLETCATIPDNELQEMRGTYESTYVFGLDVILNPFGSPSNPFSVNFTASVPNGNTPPVTVNGSGLSVTYNQDQVSYMVGIGKMSQFSGIMQAVQVRGNGQTVLANTNLTVMIPKTMMPNVVNRTRSVVGLGTKGSLVGLHY